MQVWGNWIRFPDAQSGEYVEAPIGPGIYEVATVWLAFGYAGNVANAISELKFNGGGNPFTRFFRKEPLVARVFDFEYRTCPAASRADAKIAAQRLLGLRHTAWRRRMYMGWAARHLG